MNKNQIERAVGELLAVLGEDANREGLKKTPERVAKMYAEILDGYQQDPHLHLSAVFADDGHEEMALVKDIAFSSLCEHHLLPFTGRAHIAYIPSRDRIVGLSKLARVVEGYAHRLQLQERLTSQIADALMDALETMGALVIIEAEHMCMSIRGIKKPGAKTVTSAVRGIFKDNLSTRAEALALSYSGSSANVR
jgi:GTP cyclohydrolase I